MSDYAEEMIEPKDLINRKMLQMNITLERNYEVLLSGTVYNELGVTIIGAVVEVIAVYGSNNRIRLGYVITNQEGEFTIALEKDDSVNYLLHIYEPLFNGS